MPFANTEPFRLAVCISGAVSLGSYEAGVLYEIVNAIARHNESAHVQKNPEQRIIIDVITGASAGGMTAAILAQKLLFEKSALVGAHTNDLYRAWVEEPDITRLLADSPDDDPRYSLLSSSAVHEISRKLFLSRYEYGARPQKKERHPASDGTLHLGLALANLNGVDYRRAMTDFTAVTEDGPTDTDFIYTRFQDRFTRKLDDLDDTKEAWEHIRQAAVASGAFPFAFRVCGVQRNCTEEAYDGSEPFSAAGGKFAYLDGGTFQNEPLGMAKRFVNAIDPTRKNDTRRFYLYISPHSKSSVRKAAFHDTNATFFPTAEALVNGIYNQARFQDWIMTDRYNAEVKLLDKRAEELKALMQGKKEQIGEFEHVADVILNALYNEDGQLSDGERRDDAWTRLQQQYGKEWSSLAEDGEDVQRTWLKSVLVLEKAANLGARDRMKVYCITAEDQELAGDKMVSFMGFFDIKFRHFDYEVGREKARECLKGLMKPANSSDELPLTALSFENDIAKGPDISGARVTDIPRALRSNLKSHIMARVDVLISEAVDSWIGRVLFKNIIKSFWLSKKIDEWLGL
ncbi:patatin-like phospholipase family protein [Desulfovibrio inopinatus]|uniref:patatin-like phospholipase family protein n=1 Tax=Desulfovibrio inopinatus TaxID=102109 RepID=UPI000416597B|nr:patatin-like phospholipase family protein [Desulfovibrio inopinatus]